MTIPIPGTQPNFVTKSDEERSANNPNKRDWNSVAKEIIRENADKEIVRDQDQGELWLKSPSIMHGKPRDFFDKQVKRAMLTDPNESKKKNFFPKKKEKYSGIGIKLGKSCFLGFRKIDEDDPSYGNQIGSSIPISCDF